MRRYIYHLPDWPNLRYKAEVILPLLCDVRHRQGRLLGQTEALVFGVWQQAQLEALSAEVVASSAIEGGHLPLDQVRSAIAQHLGMASPGLPESARYMDGVVRMLLDATITADLDAPLTEERLLGWHAALFPMGRSGGQSIHVGAWRDDRDGPMQVVSGNTGNPTVHFEAPTAALVPAEMDRFLAWFNTPDPQQDGLVRAALAHLWFVTIHPFDDGNGRIARAICSRALAQADGGSARYYSLSAQIYQDREAYYRVLEATQNGPSCDVTDWAVWFLGCLKQAFQGSGVTSQAALRKRAVLEALLGQVNERQAKMVEMLLDGFQGRMTSSKWAGLTGVSQDTAYRDILDLVNKGVLVKEKGGRSTTYCVARKPHET